jgi:uncharacterized membrane protein
MEEQNTNQVKKEDNTVAIISYLTLIGWIIALVMHNGENKTKLGAFHIRQSLGLMILMFAIWIVALIFVFIPFIGLVINLLLWLGMLGLWIVCIISAVNGQEKPLPVVGPMFQTWFASLAK